VCVYVCVFGAWRARHDVMCARFAFSLGSLYHVARRTGVVTVFACDVGLQGQCVVVTSSDERTLETVCRLTRKCARVQRGSADAGSECSGRVLKNVGVVL
jgi:hypothetical protein